MTTKGLTQRQIKEGVAPRIHAITKAYRKQLEIERQNGKGNIWRLEVQAYGFKAIQKAVNSYDRIMSKMNKLLFVVIRLVNKIDMREFIILKQFSEDGKEFSYWFNDITKERYKPPLLIAR